MFIETNLFWMFVISIFGLQGGWRLWEPWTWRKRVMPRSIRNYLCCYPQIGNNVLLAQRQRTPELKKSKKALWESTVIFTICFLTNVNWYRTHGRNNLEGHWLPEVASALWYNIISEWSSIMDLNPVFPILILNTWNYYPGPRYVLIQRRTREWISQVL